MIDGHCSRGEQCPFLLSGRYVDVIERTVTAGAATAIAALAMGQLGKHPVAGVGIGVVLLAGLAGPAVRFCGGFRDRHWGCQSSASLSAATSWGDQPPRIRHLLTMPQNSSAVFSAS